MDAGRELDALVAEKVLGIAITKDEHGYWPPPRPGKNFSSQQIPEYSYSISAAWEVFESIKGLNVISRDEDEGSWIVGSFETGKEILAKADSAPVAICLAALRVKGIEL